MLTGLEAFQDCPVSIERYRHMAGD